MIARAIARRSASPTEAGCRTCCRLATSVPLPRFDTIHYAGVLAAASPWRSRLKPPLSPTAKNVEPEKRVRKGGYRPWAELQRTFALDVARLRARPLSCRGRRADRNARTLVASRHSSESGSMSTTTVPSAQAFFHVIRTSPWGRWSPHSCAIGASRPACGTLLARPKAIRNPPMVFGAPRFIPRPACWVGRSTPDSLPDRRIRTCRTLHIRPGRARNTGPAPPHRAW